MPQLTFYGSDQHDPIVSIYAADAVSMVVHLHGNTEIVAGLFQIEGINHGKPWPFEHLEGERVKAQSHNGNHALDLVFDNALVNTAK